MGGPGANGQVVHYRGGAAMVGYLPFVDAGLDAGIYPHGTTDQSDEINDVIDQLEADGGGVLMLRPDFGTGRGVYRGHIQLKPGVHVISASQARGYYLGESDPGTTLPVYIKGLGSDWVVDTPTGAMGTIVSPGLMGVGVIGVDGASSGGGLRLRTGVTAAAIRNVTTSNTREQGVLLESQVLACVVEDVFIDNALLNRGRGSLAGGFEDRGTDNHISRVEASSSAGRESDVSSSDLYCVGVLVAGSAGTYTNVIGQISDIGVVVSGSANKFLGVRGDLNYAHDWLISGQRNSFAACHAIDGGRKANNTYDGFHLTSTAASNALAACNTMQLGGRTYQYSFADHGQWAYGPQNNAFAACVGEGFATDMFYRDASFGSAPVIPKNMLKPTTGTTWDVTNIGLIQPNYASPTTITGFTGGAIGQEIVIIGHASSSDVTIQQGTYIHNADYNDLVLAQQVAYKYICRDGGHWNQIKG